MLISSSEEKILSQQVEPDLQETNSDEFAILENPNSCPLPESTSTSDQVTLLNPMKLLLPPLPQRLQTSDDDDATGRPLLLYVPGMDCTGQGIRTHLPGLSASGSISRPSFNALLILLAFILHTHLFTRLTPSRVFMSTLFSFLHN